MCGELLGAERLAEDHRVDRLVDDLLEARHVDPGLARIEVNEALELGEVEPVAVDADDLLDAADAHSGEADLGRGTARLNVGGGLGED